MTGHGVIICTYGCTCARAYAAAAASHFQLLSFFRAPASEDSGNTEAEEKKETKIENKNRLSLFAKSILADPLTSSRIVIGETGADVR